jgi:hypothetical protein
MVTRACRLFDAVVIRVRVDRAPGDPGEPDFLQVAERRNGTTDER